MSGVNAARGPWRAGLPGPAWPRHDDLTLLTGTSLAFALGVSSAEGAKHLIPAQAGILAAGSRGSGTAAEHSSRFPPVALPARNPLMVPLSLNCGNDFAGHPGYGAGLRQS